MAGSREDRASTEDENRCRISPRFGSKFLQLSRRFVSTAPRSEAIWKAAASTKSSSAASGPKPWPFSASQPRALAEAARSSALALDPSRPRLLCPAMNPTMLEAPAVQRNLATLAADGWTTVAPGEGPMACGEVGRGRLAEPTEIAAAVEAALGRG